MEFGNGRPPKVYVYRVEVDFLLENYFDYGYWDVAYANSFHFVTHYWSAVED
jgi:hypothetical protein